MDLNLYKSLYLLEKQKQAIEEQQKILKEKIQKEVGEDTIETPYVLVSYTAPSTRTSINLKKLEKEDSNLFNEIKKYQKTSKVAASYKYKFKEDVI